MTSCQEKTPSRIGWVSAVPPLREAIKVLCSQGVLEVYRGKGTFVSESMESFISFGLDELDLNRSRVKDLFEARLLFEPQLAAMACQRATDEELGAIMEAGKLVEEQIRLHADRTSADQEFHQRIAVASHNRFMLQLLPIIHSAVSETIMLNEHQELLSDITLRDHALLMDFLGKRCFRRGSCHAHPPAQRHECAGLGKMTNENRIQIAPLRKHNHSAF